MKPTYSELLRASQYLAYVIYLLEKRETTILPVQVETLGEVAEEVHHIIERDYGEQIPTC